MNSGLPSVLDAIFGKQELSLVSLDEIYEVIREFPSFNAGHFLLAKKLKLQDDPGYETESMRTALYFNNPFWLQSLLDDGNHFHPAESFSRIKEEDQYIFEEGPGETTDIIQEESNYTFESYTPIEKPVTESDALRDELDEETEEILEEKLESDPVRSEDTFQYAEPGSQTVTSFDELMAKYKLQPLDLVDETAEAPTESVSEEAVVHKETEEVQDSKFPVTEPNPDENSVTDNNHPVADADQQVTDGYPSAMVIDQPLTDTHQPARDSDQPLTDKHQPARDSDQYETLEEVVNEYGIFEEMVKKTDHDHDMDAFDEPLDQIPFVSEKIVEEAVPAAHSVSTEHAEVKEHSEVKDDALVDHNTTGDAGIVENVYVSENQETEDAPHQTDEHDYDAFDRPLEEPEHAEAPVSENENSDELTDYDPDDTGETVEYSDDSERGQNGQMQELSERFEEQQKSLSAFNAKNADSIVFTPYHMVDYFASQGIKLVLEDNPPDQFGKQLKSFTDWLKVMKKVPPQHSSVKEDEKISEQIRHFAAHSIEERDILTESMAEVLAKQGMYENAIALFRKLSLIYPPKSAYFASRIEQLKASLP